MIPSPFWTIASPASPRRYPSPFPSPKTVIASRTRGVRLRRTRQAPRTRRVRPAFARLGSSGWRERFLAAPAEQNAFGNKNAISRNSAKGPAKGGKPKKTPLRGARIFGLASSSVGRRLAPSHKRRFLDLSRPGKASRPGERLARNRLAALFRLFGAPKGGSKAVPRRLVFVSEQILTTSDLAKNNGRKKTIRQNLMLSCLPP